MKWTIGKKLVTGNLIFCLLLGISGSFGYYEVSLLNSSYEDVTERVAVIQSNVENLQYQSARQVSLTRGYLLEPKPGTLLDMQQANRDIDTLMIETMPMVQEEAVQEGLVELKQLNASYKAQSDGVVALASADREAAIRLANAELLPIGNEMHTLTNRMSDLQQQIMDATVLANTEQVESSKLIFISLTSIAFVISGIIGFLMTRSISRPIVRITGAAQSIAAGDLTTDAIRLKNRDELGDLAAAFNRMTGNLRTVIQQVGASAELVAASAEQLAASSEQSSRATHHITSSMQEMAESADIQVRSVNDNSRQMGAMSESIQQVAARSQEVSLLADDASQISNEGHRTIQTAIQQMNSVSGTIQGLAQVVSGLEGRSREIGEIVEVITDIAAQTNLLALNAAIEAARAGEHGKGFSVVADEVRKLAEQSSASTQRIAELIEGIQRETRHAVDTMELGRNEVMQGIDLVFLAGQSFDRIQSSVEQVTLQIQDVSTAAQHMSVSAKQIVQTFDLLTHEVETIAAGAQNVSAASEEQLASMEDISTSSSNLTKMAEGLNESIDHFQV